MGKVAVKLRIMPESTEADLEKIKKEVAEKFEVKDISIEPVAFGLKAIKVLIVVEDSEKAGDVESEIGSIEGVGSVEVESLTLL